MALEENDRLADLVNEEPIVFMDCTQSELMGAFLISLVVGLSLGVVGGVTVGQFVLGILFGLILTLALCWLILNWLRGIRQKYYITWFKEKQMLIKRQLAPLNPAGWFSEQPRISELVDSSKRYFKGARRG